MERQNPAASSRQSTGNSHASKQRRELILRCQKILFAAYRADQYADPEGFMVSLGAVLEGFPERVITYVTDPRTGIQRRSKWPPTISELVDACEEHQDYLRRISERKPVRAEPRIARDPQPGDQATVFVPASHQRYAALVEWAKNANPLLWKFDPASDGRAGIWISYDTWDNGRPISKMRSVGMAAEALTK